MGSRRTNTPVPRGPPAAVRPGGMGGRGSPTADRQRSRQGPRRALVNGGLWLVTIPVNQRHYGDLRIFLVSLQIIVIMAALF